MKIARHRISVESWGFWVFFNVFLLVTRVLEIFNSLKVKIIFVKLCPDYVCSSISILAKVKKSENMSHIWPGWFHYHRGDRLIGLFHSDWLGAGLAASPNGPQLEEERLDPTTLPPGTIEVSCGWIWQVFLMLPRQNCHVKHPPPLS
jgi:hypothetical protein